MGKSVDYKTSKIWTNEDIEIFISIMKKNVFNLQEGFGEISRLFNISLSHVQSKWYNELRYTHTVYQTWCDDHSVHNTKIIR